MLHVPTCTCTFSSNRMFTNWFKAQRWALQFKVTVANLVMEDIEERALESFNIRHKFISHMWSSDTRVLLCKNLHTSCSLPYVFIRLALLIFMMEYNQVEDCLTIVWTHSFLEENISQKHLKFLYRAIKPILNNIAIENSLVQATSTSE